MLAGLLFAIEDAEDRPGRLAATLPFGGLTLIEYQARALAAAGASQIAVVVARVTPELLGALTRIRGRGLAVDAVRTAAEAVARLHPLARVLMLGDGLVTTDGVVEAVAAKDTDTLLVMPEEEAPARWERVGAGMAWAGVARLDPQRVAELARLPADYDVQSSLLRLTDQAGARHLRLPREALRQGHGIERRGDSLAARGRTVLAVLIGSRQGWFDRWVVGPVARLLLPRLVEGGVSTLPVAAGGAALGAGGIGLAGWGMVGAGAIVALLGCLVLELGATLAGLRDEDRIERAQALGLRVVPALSVAAIGWAVEGSALVVALAGITAAAIGERAASAGPKRRWWGRPPGYLLVVAAGALAGAPIAGLAAAGIYAAATLAAAVEALRRRALASL